MHKRFYFSYITEIPELKMNQKTPRIFEPEYDTLINELNIKKVIKVSKESMFTFTELPNKHSTINHFIIIIDIIKT